MKENKLWPFRNRLVYALRKTHELFDSSPAAGKSLFYFKLEAKIDEPNNQWCLNGWSMRPGSKLTTLKETSFLNDPEKVGGFYNFIRITLRPLKKSTIP